MSHNCQPGVSAWAHPVVTNTGPLEYAVDQLIPGLCEALETRCQPEVLVMHPWEDDLVERSVMELCRKSMRVAGNICQLFCQGRAGMG